MKIAISMCKSIMTEYLRNSLVIFDYDFKNNLWSWKPL